ncbi:hypothetical protein FDECE_14300 [Fusarium decemcellulare]|nr:hypothetical protein FDECE_14300 [Fusarium decemcellulare]
MSRQPPDVRPGQGSYGQFQLEASHPREPPLDRGGEILKKLREGIPKDEDQWRQMRQQHDFDTAEAVVKKVTDIVEDKTPNQGLRNFIRLAICCVEWHRGQKTAAYDNYRSHVSSDILEFTIEKYMTSVRNVIQSLDKVYLRGLRHRTFEAFFLYSRIGPSFLNHYNKSPQEFEACFPTSAAAEIQGSLALSAAFIVRYRHPQQYRYDEICEALGTHVLGEDEYSRFAQVLASGKPIPRLLPLPEQSQGPLSSSSTRGHYDPVRDKWEPEAEVADYVHAEQKVGDEAAEINAVQKDTRHALAENRGPVPGTTPEA